MSTVNIGEIVKVRFGIQKTVVKPARVLAVKPGSSGILIESDDGSIMAFALPVTTNEDGSQFKADSICALGHNAYTRQSAAKALGFKGLKLN